MFRFISTAVLLTGMAALLIGVATQGAGWRLPDRHNPWAPLRIAEEPGWLTRTKLGRLSDEPALCRSVLAKADMRAEAMPDRVTGPGCGFENAVQVRRTQLDVGPAFVLSCRAAVSLALWERHVLLPEASRHYGRPVVQVHHFGSYACRNVYGRATGRLSQHATADALDIAGFTLEGGRRITVARDWSGDGVDARFLRAVHRGACRFFDGVLGPEYNAAHADHLHLDRGPYRICR